MSTGRQDDDIWTHEATDLSEIDKRAAESHVLAAYISPTLEVMVTVDPVAMQKRFSSGTDLTLTNPA